jgi:hypothetical protein
MDKRHVFEVVQGLTSDQFYNPPVDPSIPDSPPDSGRSPTRATESTSHYAVSERSEVTMNVSRPLLDIADSMLYVSALLADQSRRIGAVIDYFGAFPVLVTAPAVVGRRGELVVTCPANA